MIKESIRIVSVLAAICACISLLVAAVYSITEEQIAKNTEIKIEKALSEIFPVYSSKSTLEFEKPDESINSLYKINDGDTVIGYAVDITTKGYGSDGINMMIGVNSECKVISVVIVSATSETPGLGQNITKADYLSAFAGMQSGEKADTLAGATSSSKAVQYGVDVSLEAVKSIVNGELSVKEAEQ